MTGPSLISESISQISGVNALPPVRPWASAKALRAFCAFSPSLPSISPGENWARSSRTCSLMTTASILSVGSFARYSALLTAVASMLAPAAGNASQTDKIAATNKRTIRQPPAKIPENKNSGARGFRWAARTAAHHMRRPKPIPPLLRPLHRRLLHRLFGIAEVMRGIDQRDVGERLREIAGLAALAGIVFLRQQAEIVRDRDHTVEQRLRLGSFAG